MTAVTTVKSLDDSLQQLNEMKSAAHENLKMLEQIEANIKTLQESTAHGLVVHNGKVLVQVERKAREGDYVVFEGLSTVLTTNDKFYEVCKPHGTPMYYDDESYIRDVYAWLECPEPKVKVYEVIGNLPQSFLVVEAFEPIPIENGTKPPCKHMSANQKRARAIAMAKLFVEDTLAEHSWYATRTKFNDEEGKVKVSLNVATNNTLKKGKAKCKEGHVYNRYIGQAIALAKALDIVEQLPPDILNAVRPDSFVKGMKVVWVDRFGNAYERIVKRVENSNVFFTNKRNMPKHRLAIIDDTDADYSLQGGEN